MISVWLLRFVSGEMDKKYGYLNLSTVPPHEQILRSMRPPKRGRLHTDFVPSEVFYSPWNSARGTHHLKHSGKVSYSALSSSSRSFIV